MNIKQNEELSRELALWKDLVWQLREELNGDVRSVESCEDELTSCYWEARISGMLDECELTLDNEEDTTT